GGWLRADGGGRGRRRGGRSRGAGCCRRGGEPLIRGYVLDEPEQLGRQRRLGEGGDGVSRDDRGDLDEVVVREAAERAFVADVDLVHARVAGVERPDQADRRLAVEGAAALLEQRRLLGQGRVAVELEQLALDL